MKAEGGEGGGGRGGGGQIRAWCNEQLRNNCHPDTGIQFGQ